MSILSPAEEMGEAVQGTWHRHWGRVSLGFWGAEVSPGVYRCDASVGRV